MGGLRRAADSSTSATAVLHSPAELRKDWICRNQYQLQVLQGLTD